MILHKTFGKFLLITGIIFLMLNTSSLALTQDKLQNSSRQEPIPHVFGQMGENQWFISAVTITFDYDPAKVLEIQYNLSGEWKIYFEPFSVVDDGRYFIQWIWIETSGRPHDGLPIEFKIDKTPPTIELNKKSAGKNKLTFTAVADDDVSEIERVEFYLDDVLAQTVTKTPYQYNWTGEEKQTVYAIAYDYAGHLVKSDNLSTTPRSHFRNYYLIEKITLIIQVLFDRIF